MTVSTVKQALDRLIVPLAAFRSLSVGTETFRVGMYWVSKAHRGNTMLRTILLVLLILLVLGSLPTWPYSTGWGYYPSGGLGLLLVILVVLIVVKKI